MVGGVICSPDRKYCLHRHKSRSWIHKMRADYGCIKWGQIQDQIFINHSDSWEKTKRDDCLYMPPDVSGPQ